MMLQDKYEEVIKMGTDKELNVHLFDQLDIVEDALEIAESEHASKTIEYLKNKKKKIERKLYQKPPLIDNE